jgi:MFS superfamily sulfate permease-like transporter
MEIWQISRWDALPLVATFIGCLFDTADGILIGIALHLVILLYRYAFPVMHDHEENGVLTISIESDLFFPSAEKLSDQLMLYQELYSSKMVVIDLSKIAEIDSAATQSIKTTIQTFKKVKSHTMHILG